MVQYPQLDAFAFRPVLAGLWRHHELFDGTYDFEDLLDIHELLDVKHENERRAEEWARSQRVHQP